MIAQLESNPNSWKILEQIPSTNTFLLDSDFPSGTVCIAHRQSAGRGQHGRTWVSLYGDAFLFSALLRIPEASLPITYLPVLTGVTVLQALGAHRNDFAQTVPKDRSDIKLQLKWPNDIYIVHPQACGKLGGVLIESRKDLERSTKEKSYLSLVLGIGINWSGAERDLKALLSNLDHREEKTNISPSILYINSKKGQKMPAPLSFAPYIVERLNQGLLKLQNKNYDFIDEARKSFYLSGRLVRYEARVYSVKGLSEKCELLLEDIKTGKYKKIRSVSENFELLERAYHN